MLTAIVPFSQMEIRAINQLSVLGIGDATLLAHAVFSFEPFEDAPLTLLLGGGIKLPTGASALTDDSGARLDTRAQSGSGSVDFIFNPAATLQLEAWTLALDALAKVNTSNRFNTTLGNSASLSATASRDLLRHNPSSFAVIGTLGGRVESAAQDRIGSTGGVGGMGGTLDEDSGYTALYLNAGGQAMLGAFRLTLTGLFPLSQSRPALSMREDARMLAGLRVEF